jgi:RNA polymerase sigma-70 factor (ECF subfamily)
MTGRSSSARATNRLSPGEQGAAPGTHELPTFETIYHQYFDFVWSSARRLGVGAAAMDDVVQEIFMVIHSKIQTLRQPESLRSWIYGVVRRRVSEHHRSQRSREASGVALALQADLDHRPAPTPLDLTEQSDQAVLLWSVLEEIDWPKREVFMLAELDEMTAPEIAAALHIPLNTVYSRLRAARIAFEEARARRAARRTREF